MVWCLVWQRQRQRQVFLCFLVDEKYNVNTPRMRAHKDLAKLVSDHAEMSRQTGTQIKADSDPTANQPQAQQAGNAQDYKTMGRHPMHPARS